MNQNPCLGLLRENFCYPAPLLLVLFRCGWKPSSEYEWEFLPQQHSQHSPLISFCMGETLLEEGCWWLLDHPHAHIHQDRVFLISILLQPGGGGGGSSGGWRGWSWGWGVYMEDVEDWLRRLFTRLAAVLLKFSYCLGVWCFRYNFLLLIISTQMWFVVL